MLDLYPDPADQARIKVLADVLSCGVVDEIKKGKSDPISLSRYRKIVEEKYGYSPRLIEESIIRWTNAFEIKPAEQPAKKASTKPAEFDIGETIHVHKFKDTVVNPTCRERGYTLHQCACGYEHKDSFTPVGQHRFEQVDEIKPSCFEEGRQDFLCSVCAEYKSEPIPKVPHKYGEWIVIEDVTCEKNGIKERHCLNCAASESQTFHQLGHWWTEWSTQSFATCTEEGKEARQCKRCKSVEEKVLPATGHDFSEWVPSQSQEGMYERYCKNCGELELKTNEDVIAELKEKNAEDEKKKRIMELDAKLQILYEKKKTIGEHITGNFKGKIILTIVCFLFGIGSIAYFIIGSDIIFWQVDLESFFLLILMPLLWGIGGFKLGTLCLKECMKVSVLKSEIKDILNELKELKGLGQ